MVHVLVGPNIDAGQNDSGVPAWRSGSGGVASAGKCAIKLLLCTHYIIRRWNVLLPPTVPLPRDPLSHC